MINIQTLDDGDNSYLGVYVNGELVINTDKDYFDDVLTAICNKLRELGIDVSYEHYTIEDVDEFEDIWIQGEGYPKEYPYL